MAAPDRVRIAASQSPIGEPKTFAEWQETKARWVAEGAATGAQILVFPEYGLMELAATCGTRIASDLKASLAAVADLADPVGKTFAELAKHHRVYLLAPSGPMRRGDDFINAAALFAPSGACGIAEKLIMTPFERTWGLSGGQRGRVFDTVLGRIGVAICYDSEFPLLVRAQAEAGADIVLIPSCTEKLSGYHRVRTAALARALESQVATVVSQTVGDALWSPAVDRNRGAAGIFVPAEHSVSDTGVLVEGVLDQPKWITADIDLASIRRLRTSGEMRNAADWSLQPGAAPLSSSVEVVQVR